jgi:hypothetical protein
MFAIVRNRNRPSSACVHRKETKPSNIAIALQIQDLLSEKAAVSSIIFLLFVLLGQIKNLNFRVVNRNISE